MIVKYYLKYVNNWENFQIPDQVTFSWSLVTQWEVDDYSQGFIYWYEQAILDAKTAATEDENGDYPSHFFAAITKQDSFDIFQCVRLDQFLKEHSFIHRMYNAVALGRGVNKIVIET